MTDEYTTDREGKRVRTKAADEAYRQKTLDLTDKLMHATTGVAARDEAFAEVRRIANDPTNSYDLHDAFSIVLAEVRKHGEPS